MKYIFVSSSFNIGGVATSFSTLVDGAISENDQVEFHVVDQVAEIKAYIPDRVKVVHVHGHYRDIYDKGTKNGTLFLLKKHGIWSAIKRIFIRFLEIFDIHKPFILNKELFDGGQKYTCDVCVVLKENDPCLFYAINNVESRKRIAFFHTAGYLREEYKPIYYSPMIDEIITVSKGNRDFLVGRMPEAARKIHVMHNIVPVDRIKTLATTSKRLFKKDEMPILFVGRICEEKGTDAIIETAELLKDELPNIHWHLLGRFDKGLSSKCFDEILVEKGIKERVTVLPASINPYPYIAQAWVIVNPSRIESYGMVIREAQILGKPVIATKTYGGVELIEDGKTGLLVDIDNAYQIADAIKKLYNDANCYQGIVANLSETDFDESELVREQFNALLK